MKHLFITVYSALTLTLLATSCRSTHAVTKVQKAAQTTAVSRSRADAFCTFSDVLQQYDLQADSMVVWWNESVPEELSTAPSDTTQCDIPFKAFHIPNTPHKGGAGGGVKLLLSGVHLYGSNVQHGERKSASVDSLMASHKSDSSSQVKEKTKTSYARAYIIFFVFMILMGVFIRKVVWHK